MERWYGIDFSGNHEMWRAQCRSSNVWLAEVQRADGLVLNRLARVQSALGGQAPFAALAALLAGGDYAAAAIDAPFSVPEPFVAACGGYEGMLARVASVACDGRPFLTGGDLVRSVAGQDAPLSPPKPLRQTERLWAQRRVNVRSTMWVTPRGGAPMTAACLSLLHRAQRPIWPWTERAPGLLVEAFPAAQLCEWQLPHQGYADRGEAASAVRERIVAALATRLELGSWREAMIGDADALDAVLCAFAAIAVTDDRLAAAPPELTRDEGWIAVHA